jgi:hypothetical protein
MNLSDFRRWGKFGELLINPLRQTRDAFLQFKDLLPQTLVVLTMLPKVGTSVLSLDSNKYSKARPAASTGKTIRDFSYDTLQKNDIF